MISVLKKLKACFNSLHEPQALTPRSARGARLEGGGRFRNLAPHPSRRPPRGLLGMRPGLAKQTFIRNESGSALLEGAIVFPLLLTLGLGAIEFSNAFYDHQEITTGLRDAARYMARVLPTGSVNNPCANATAMANAQNLAVNGVISGGSARISGWTTGNVTISCAAVSNASSTYRGPSTLYIVTASTAVTYPQFGLLTFLGLTAPTINLSHSERWIGG